MSLARVSSTTSGLVADDGEQVPDLPGQRKGERPDLVPGRPSFARLDHRGRPGYALLQCDGRDVGGDERHHSAVTSASSTSGA